MGALSFSELIQLVARDLPFLKHTELLFPDEGAFCNALYLVQQLIEKLLKAYILYLGQDFPFTHDISQLAAKCIKLGGTLPQAIVDNATLITIWESKTRYDPYAVFSPTQYETVRSAMMDLYSKVRALVDTEQTSEF